MTYLLYLIYESTKHTRELFKGRKDEIEARKREQVATKIRAREAREKKKIADKEKISIEMIEYGLWQSEAEVEEQVASYRTVKDKTDALKSQLRFQQVLEQTSDCPNVYQFTKLVGGKRQQLSI